MLSSITETCGSEIDMTTPVAGSPGAQPRCLEGRGDYCTRQFVSGTGPTRRSREAWFYSNMHLLHRRFPESACVGGSAGDMLVLWHAYAVRTTDATALRVLLRSV